LFRIADEGMEPMFAERAYAVHLCGVSVSNEESWFWSGIQHFWAEGQSEVTNFDLTQGKCYFSWDTERESTEVTGP